MEGEIHGDYDDIYKVIVVGETNCGKTNIISAYFKDKVPVNVMPTIGVEYTSKSVRLDDGSVIKTQIWDTAGQEQYRSVTMMNYRRAIGAFVVFDVTNRQTFNRVSQWLSSVRERADVNVQIGILGHKVDLVRREVMREEAETLANRENAFYAETTVKDIQTIRIAFKKLMTNVATSKKSETLGVKLTVEQPSKGCSC